MEKAQKIPSAAPLVALGLFSPIIYMWNQHLPWLYILTVMTPACLGSGLSLLLSKNKIMSNPYAVVISIIILLVVSYPFVIPIPAIISPYNQGTSFIAIIASVIGSTVASHQYMKKQVIHNQMNTEEFISTLTKLTSLRNADMLSEEEFNHQKGELIKSITGKSIDGDHLTFLAEIAKLKQQNVLTNEDIANIKAMVMNS
ncbi:hypothetical protein [Providencia sp. PROV046]|nr:hypothetical protein [Providencia sp. PROV046]WOB99067.1 hypothetical protein P3L55_17650 [Providencia sp. PROV046]